MVEGEFERRRRAKYLGYAGDLVPKEEKMLVYGREIEVIEERGPL